MVLLEFAMNPLDKGENLGDYVSRSLDIIDRSGLSYQITPMGTIIEGEWNEVMDVVTRCFERMRTDCGRIGTHIMIDYRSGSASRLKSKVATIEKTLGRTLSK